ncbi:hypothetical protein [Staphylococcus sp. IVB6214]|uniref:hypothetical protein n=1 Tax=Staphylococcus sp. IVB6214 TaxID=2989766 RepID=UPI0021CEE463|nr:hypothetical protein [Staphylococcus sp. IVB6214]UXR83171.1 hypothetical protein MUA51_03710 [Staphylococcus sp. IVB6214]
MTEKTLKSEEIIKAIESLDESTEKAFEEKILSKALLNKEAFLNQYNPWQKEAGQKLIGNFSRIINKLPLEDGDKNAETFSWLDYDEKMSNIIPKITTDIDKNKMHYAMPNHVQGNIETANLFLCLTNPSIAGKFAVDDKSYQNNILNFHEAFLKIIDKNKVIVNPDPSAHLENFQSYDNDVTKDLVYQHIVNNGKSEVEDEIIRLLDEKNDDNLIKKEVENQFDNYYYLKSYYKWVLHNDEVKGLQKYILNHLNDREGIIKHFQNIKTCNLESFPYRSTNPNLSNKGDGLGDEILGTKNDIILFSSRIIMRRIALYINGGKDENEKPSFIFRRFNDVWEDSLKKVLLDDYSFSENELDKVLGYLRIHFFYTFTSIDNDFKLTKGHITKGNVYHFTSENSKVIEEPIGIEGLKYFRKMILPDQSE